MQEQIKDFQKFGQAALKLARYQTITDASACIVEIEKRKGDVSPKLLAQMETLRAPLFQLITLKNEFSDMAKTTLISMGHAITFAKTKDATAHTAMIKAFKQSDVKAEQIRKGQSANG